jgi:hypothetical protein
MVERLWAAWAAWQWLAMPIGWQAGMLGPPPNYELRQDLYVEVREDGSPEVRDGY